MSYHIYFIFRILLQLRIVSNLGFVLNAKIFLGRQLQTRNRHVSSVPRFKIHYNWPFTKLNTILRGFDRRANYADRATAAFWGSSTNFLRIEDIAWSAQRIPTVVNLYFLDRSRYIFFQVAPQLFSRGWVDPVPNPLLFRKSGSAENETRDLWICSQKLWPLDHRGDLLTF
jgi:hypothetical protein